MALRRRAQLQDDPGAGRLHCGGHTARPPLIRLLRRNPLAAGRRRSRPCGSTGPAPAAAGELAGALRKAFAFDEPAAQAIPDRLVTDLSVTTSMREIVLPNLAELGDRWDRGDASIAQEHFASAAADSSSIAPLVDCMAGFHETGLKRQRGVGAWAMPAHRHGRHRPGGDKSGQREGNERVRGN